jgi:uncharacterized protein YkwD
VRLWRKARLVLLGAAVLGGFAFPRVEAALVADAPGCPRSGEIPTPSNVESTRAAILCLLNAERAKHGLGPLRRNELLELASQRHSQDMVDQDFFSHDTPGGTDPEIRIRSTGYAAPLWGENLLWGTEADGTPVKAVEGWMNSPGHRAAILEPRFTEVGVGIVHDAPKGGIPGRVAVYTTDFGG